jgi:hypothetical protein
MLSLEQNGELVMVFLICIISAAVACNDHECLGSREPSALATPLQVQARGAHPVPATPPDTVAAWVYADSALLRGPYAIGSHTSRHTLLLAFRDGTSLRSKEAAIDSVRGIVVGGDARLGLYVVRVPSDSTPAPLFAAQSKLRNLPQVAMVILNDIGGASSNSMRPDDAGGWPVPTTVPSWLYDDSSHLSGNWADPGTTSRFTLILAFKNGTSRQQMQAALDSVNGKIVGGYAPLSHYIVQVPSDTTGALLAAASAKLRTLPQVKRAEPHMTGGVGVYRKADNGAARAIPDSVRRRNDCRLAAQTVSTGNPAAKMQWALQLIPSCGDQGNIGTPIAAALTRLRASSDTGQLLALRNATFGFVDGSIYSAAMSIATDDSASPTARAVNLLIVLTQVQRDAYVPYAALLSATMSETEFCPGGTTYDVPHLAGPVPLPPDAKTQALALAQRLQRNASLPTLVRVAARCVVQGAN